MIKKYILPIIFLTIGLILGYYLRQNSIDTVEECTTSTDHASIYPFLKNPENKGPMLNQQQSNILKAKIDKYITEKKDTPEILDISVEFTDLNGGPTFSIGGSQEYIMASLVKIPLIMSEYKITTKNPELLNEAIMIGETWEREDMFEGYGVNKIKPGIKYNFQYILENQIVSSDNISKDVIIEHLINRGFEKNLATNLKILNHSLDDVLPGRKPLNATVGEISNYFRILYNSTFNNKNNSNRILELMASSTYVEGIVKPIPGSINISHKYGVYSLVEESTSNLHDCGIIYYPEHPYILCIMTKGNELEKQRDVIAEISKMVYDDYSNIAAFQDLLVGEEGLEPSQDFSH